MASHGKNRHLKRIAAPRQLQVHRKKALWLKLSKPGPHAMEVSIPILVLLRDLLKICTNSREAKKILNKGMVLVDGRPVKDIGFPVGLMDVVSLKNSIDHFLIAVNKMGKLAPVKTEQGGQKLCKITGKRVLQGGKVQLALHDGRSLVVPDAKEYATGDTLKISIPKAEVKARLKLEKGSRCYIFRGRHAGAVGSLVEIHVFPGITPSNARIVDESKNEVVTLKDYVFVVDENFKI